eukprot:354835-Rhodomonas_salina.1
MNITHLDNHTVEVQHDAVSSPVAATSCLLARYAMTDAGIVDGAMWLNYARSGTGIVAGARTALSRAVWLSARCALPGADTVLPAYEQAIPSPVLAESSCCYLAKRVLGHARY